MATRPIIFGEIPHIPEGHRFEGRKEMMPTSFHRNWGAGIDGNGTTGTAAIVLSGGYEDDEDNGEVIYSCFVPKTCRFQSFNFCPIEGNSSGI